MDFRKVFISVALLGLVIFGMLSFIITTQSENNSNERIVNNQLINKTYGDLYSNLSSAQTTAEQQNTVFGNITPTESYG
jgi:Tfp pilus assembly protein PilV